MKTSKLILPLAVATTLVFASCSNGGSDSAQTQDTVPAIDFASLDTTVRAQDDFYHYANGGWIKNNPLKPAYSRYGTFDILGDTVNAQIRKIVDEVSASTPKKGTNEYRIAVLYRQAMDSTTRNSLGAKPLLEDLKEVEKLQTKADLISYAASQDQVYGSSTFFGSYVAADDKNSSMNILQLSQIGLGLGTKDYYVEETPESKKIVQGYTNYLKKVLSLAGYSEADADRMSKNAVKVETELARISYSKLELRDPERNYNIVSIADFAKENKGFDWATYFQKRGLKVETANFGQLEFFKKFDKWFAAANIADLKDYLLTGTVSSSATALSDDFAKAQFDFFGTELSGVKEQKPRWERCLSVVDGLLGEALGEVYVKRYFSPEAKQRMLTLVGNLQKALSQRINGLEWMSPATKEKAQAKLNNFTVKIGYPDKWKDYSSLVIDESNTYYQNLKNASKFAQADNLKDLGQPVDRSKWLMNPHEVNAYYMPTTNEICFPAGILQPPFFNMNADDAVNYGAIGVVIGHEMTHGFDDQGAQYDKDGNLLNWWTPEDLAKFKASTARLADQFSRNEVAPGVFADGKNTLGENIADQGGLLVAHLALKLSANNKPIAPKDGLTADQRFYLGYAHLWGQNITEAEIRRLTKLDPHSLGILRVNQALQNISPFIDAFGLKPGDKLYLDPKDRVVVW